MRPPRHVTRRLLAGLAVLAAPFLRALGEAVAPAIESVYPAGGRVGTEFPIEVSGTWPEWPVAVRAAVDGVTVSPGPRPGAFQVRVAASAPAGPTLLRFFTAGGAGDPVQFVLSDTPEILEPEEGQENAAAPIVRSLPATLNGRLRDPDEVDAWLFPVASPTQISVTMAALSLDVPLVATLTLLDGEGQTVTVSADAPGRDPSLTAALNRPGLYRLLVGFRSGMAANAEAGLISLAGADAIYRVTLRGESIIETPEDPTNNLGPLDPNILRPETAASQYDLPVSIRGFISPAGDRDRYGFTARALERFDIGLATARIGSPLNGLIEIADGSGEILASAIGPDASLSWVAPNDGEYVVWVSEVAGGGGSACLYDLEIGAPEPELNAGVNTHTLRLPPGASTNLTLAVVVPLDYGALMTVSAEGLPPGVSVTAGPLAPGLHSTTPTLIIASDTPPTNCPIRLTVFAADPTRPQTVPARATIQGRHAPPDGLLINHTDQIWLTILPPE